MAHIDHETGDLRATLEPMAEPELIAQQIVQQTDLQAIDAMLARVPKTSRAWRNRCYLYRALHRFQYCERFGFPAQAERAMWMSLLFWGAHANVTSGVANRVPGGDGE